MTVDPADDPVLRFLEEAGLGEDRALAAVLTELQATAAAEPPAPSRDVARLMSGRRPARSSWFARRGVRTTTVVLLAAVLAGGASAAAASPGFHAVVGDAFSSLVTLVRPPTHPGPPAHPGAAEPEHIPATGATESAPITGGRAGSTERPGSAGGTGSTERPETAEAGDEQGAPASPPSTVQKDDGADRPTTAGSGRSVGQSAGSGDDQGTSGGSSTQKKAPARFEPVPSPAPVAGAPATRGDSSDSGEQGGSGR